MGSPSAVESRPRLAKPRSPWVRALGALAGLLALALIAGLIALVMRPLRALELLGRSALRGAGLQKTTLAGPRGRLTVFRGGGGPTVVLIHGVNDQAGGWARVAGPLTASFRVVVPDLPGHGESDPAQGPLTVDELMAGLALVLAQEKPPALLVGNSMGGWLALLAAREHPQAVAGVVLVNGAAVRGPAAVSLLPHDRDEARKAMAAVFSPNTPLPPAFVLDDLVRRAPTSPLARLLGSSWEAHVLDGRLQDVTVPVTLLWGEDDRLLPPAYAERIARELPRARLELLPRCGHMPQRECPERLLPALQRALGASGR